jgi:hypothetical protein
MTISPDAAPSLPPTSSRSGRVFVTAAGVTILLIAGGLSLAFRAWRADYRARADFGRRAVAAAVDPLAELVPPDVPAASWRRAVGATRALLVEVSASGRLDWARLRALRADVARRVARARRETARAELAGIWDQVQAKAILRDRSRRPELLGGPPDPR